MLTRSLSVVVSLCACLGTVLAAVATAPLETVPAVDLDRYQGRWYEIARKPNRFQKACAGAVMATYTLRPDARIDVLNECTEADGDTRAADGVARLPDKDDATRLEVRFAPAFLSFLSAVWGDYWVIDLDPEYRWAVIGEPKRKYFWVLARIPKIEEQTLKGILERAEAQGYDLSDLLRTRQGEPVISEQ